MSEAAAAVSEPPKVRSVAPCLWCGPGTALAIETNRMGAQFVACRSCGSRGPSIEIQGDFEEADENAISAWSTRPVPLPTLPADVRDRVAKRIQFQRFLSGGETPDMEVSLRYADVARLLNGYAAR